MARRIGDYNGDYLLNQRPGRFGLKLVGIGIVVVLVLCGAGFLVRWLMVPAKVFSPENVQAQWQFAYDYTESMNGIARQWCTASAAEQAATVSEEKLQRSSQRIAIEQNYARVAAEYDGRVRDAFRAGLVKPPDVPDRAPVLTQVTNKYC